MWSSEHIPTNRYRVDLAPSKLTYRNGTVILETLCLDDGWTWRAKTDGAGVHSVILLQRPTLLALVQDQFEGFDVDAGTPADRIMMKIVTQGGALRMRPRERYVPPRRKRGV